MSKKNSKNYLEFVPIRKIEHFSTDDNGVITLEIENKGVMIDDLFKFAKDFECGYYADYCHYTSEGFKIIADHISEYLSGVLYNL